MAREPLILAIETSGRLGSVAIAIGKQMLAQTAFSGPMRHSSEVFPAISGLLKRFSRKPDDIEHIYISVGPGSFTGLRIAVSIAKTMHLANGVKVIAVDTLDVIAANSDDYIRREKASVKKIAVILDAKRGDIGNTSQMYAHAFFKTLDFDAITLSPYMGKDSISPFLEVKGKWTILLALTSNEGSKDFQLLQVENGHALFEKVITTSAEWGSVNNIMYVVGATKAEALVRIRELIPEHFLLVPGVGSQGGSLQEVAEYGMNDRCGLLVNASRSIIYADGTNKFEDAASNVASGLQAQMEEILLKRELI